MGRTARALPSATPPLALRAAGILVPIPDSAARGSGDYPSSNNVISRVTSRVKRNETYMLAHPPFTQISIIPAPKNYMF